MGLRSLLRGFALGSALTALAPGAWALNSAWSPTALELVGIPQYCWGHMNTEFKGNPRFMIENCGNGIHHYCVALVYLSRAQKVSLERYVRRDSVLQAKTELDYAIQRLTPECPTDVRAGMEGAVARQRALQSMFKK